MCRVIVESVLTLDRDHKKGDIDDGGIQNLENRGEVSDLLSRVSN